jgi:hypothetical protein
MGKHEQKIVQWVWNGLKPIKEEKNDIFLYFLKIAPMVFCTTNYCIVSFRYVSLIPVWLVLVIKFWYNNYRYRFCNFKNWYDKNWYRYRACLRSRPCLLHTIHVSFHSIKVCLRLFKQYKKSRSHSINNASMKISKSISSHKKLRSHTTSYRTGWIFVIVQQSSPCLRCL